MPDTDDTRRNRRIDRRKFLAGLGAGTTTSVAGCSDLLESPTEDDDVPRNPDEEPPDTPTETLTPSGPQPGGKPIEGMDEAPSTLNPLKASTAYEFEVIAMLYDFGTVVHPDDYSFSPWSFADWDLDVGNIGTADPTIVAELRDDLSFSDGEPLTAGDYKFTVEYLQEQEVGGFLFGDHYDDVEEVRVDDPDGTRVELFLKRKAARWFTHLLGSIILPAHVWSDVSDFKNYSPRAEGGPIGSGVFVLEDFDWGNWFELSARPPEEVPWPSADYVDWIHEDGPFVDGVRIELFDSTDAVEQALLGGEIDVVGPGGVSIETAQKARERDHLAVHGNAEGSYNHVSLNLRRVPFDDVAFRQLLRMLMDGDWIVEEAYEGLGATKGDYATIPAYEDWRPPAPTEADQYEGIELPSLQFPGDAGTFRLGESGVQAAREFLTNHPDAKHDYSFGESRTSITTAPDDNELYVDGQHLTEAHTNNVGEAGQGPLLFRFQPPTEDVVQSRTGQRYLAALKAVGIPVRAKVESFDAQLMDIFSREEFDLFAMGWGLGVDQTHLVELFSSEEADLSYQDPDREATSAFKPNPMGYTGADDLIFRLRDSMAPAERKRWAKKALAQIWHDVPTIVTDYPPVLEPTSGRFTGYVDRVGGILNDSTWLNVHRDP